ncbi:indolepyruvate oxidoreductase subunit beta [Desulfatitalea alkaliphila]|uniref:Indolepyruvate oxidoreductase subunit beta n=1 Tax=Desulfatitalea alkaliphila TaxID=2929485 RepID=A0AA41R3P2_9BACT|nr:indolepyruvate oxidoreductase subunit beta [Desulfatitalea alkaliphila]MCJ8502637.1 indolepyruvate oxidoreductase subunit beta [Desulfatitalea alkaliphila]
MKTLRIMIVAVGGQGNILAARILGEAAAAVGITPRMSEFHGMAQRGGVVESMVLLGEGRAYCIPDGEADILLGFEPSETIRAAKKCGAHSVIITNTAPQPPFTVATGQSRYPDIDAALAKLAGRVKRLIALDATSLAARAGSPLSLNMVMLGALAGSGATHLPPEKLRDAIQAKTKAAHTGANLAAFELGANTGAQM